MTLHVLTNLPAEVSAIGAAELYRQRWSIETLFDEVTQTLACEIKTLCYPPAALFVYCLALMAATAVAVLKGALRATHGAEEADALSAYYLALEIKQVNAGMIIALPADEWTNFRTMRIVAFADQLRAMARQMDLALYRKSTRGPKKPPRPKRPYKKGGHVSTYKELRDKKP